MEFDIRTVGIFSDTLKMRKFKLHLNCERFKKATQQVFFVVEIKKSIIQRKSFHAAHCPLHPVCRVTHTVREDILLRVVKGVEKINALKKEKSSVWLQVSCKLLRKRGGR